MGDLATLVLSGADGSKRLNLTLRGDTAFNFDEFVVRAHAGHQLTLQERETGAVWVTGYDPCSFEASYASWHSFELGMLPQASVGNDTALAV